MAKEISLKNPSTGEIKTGYYGYSWTTLLFGSFPPLFRGDFLTFIGSFVIFFILAIITTPIGGIGGYIGAFVWSFFYNNYYTINLIRKGFKLNGTNEQNKEAAMNLKIELNEYNSINTEE